MDDLHTVRVLKGAEAEQALARQFRDKLAADHKALSGSVSTFAIACYWTGRDHLAACRKAVAAA